MQAEQAFRFGSYRLDPQTGQLWRGKQEVRLTGKASALLRSLVERAGRVVTKEELFREVWPDTAVSDAALTSCIQELRRVLRDQAREIAAELAVHFERGRDYQRAVQYRQQAGETAIQRNAHHEAITHLTKGLELLKHLPDTPERIQQELSLQLALTTPLIVTKGYASLEAEKVYTRARELCQQAGETPRLFPVLVGSQRLYAVQAKYKEARELGEQLLSLAQRTRDPTRLLGAHQMLGNTLFHIGEFVPAREHLEQGIALYDLRQHRHHAFRSGQDAGVACLGYTAWILWCLGYPNQARKRCHEALALAQELSHPFNIAWTALSAIVFYQLLWEEQASQEQAEAAITLASEQGFAFVLAYAASFKGWALAMQGRGEEGIAQIRQGMVAWQATGAEFWRPHYLALLAEAYAKVGQAEDGLNMLTEAMAVATRTGERSYEAELYRLKGILTLQSKASLEHVQDTSKTGQNKSAVTNSRPLTPNPQGEAAACFLKAIEIARTQSAKSWELRAATSLARLW